MYLTRFDVRSPIDGITEFVVAGLTYYVPPHAVQDVYLTLRAALTSGAIPIDDVLREIESLGAVRK